LGTIKELCDEVLWLNDGEVMMKGDASEVIPKYEEFMKNL
jgi:ABC-type polysaccharide/polyol phosphate transport system ATPase subunit